MNDRGDAEGADAVAEAKSWLAVRGVEPPAPPPPSRETAAEPSRGGRQRADRPVPSPGPTAPTAPADREAEDLARTIVLRKLSAQARTRQELSKVLQAKEVPTEVGNAVLDRMEDVGLVDDAEFARSWVESRQSRRYLSKSALRRELSGKGVAKDEIDSALENVDSDDEYAAALALAQKKYRSMGALQRDVQYRRLTGALARRGFGFAICSRVLAEVLDGRSLD